MAAGGVVALELVVDVRGRAELLLKTVGAHQRRGTVHLVKIADLLRDGDISGRIVELLLDELFAEHDAELLGAHRPARTGVEQGGGLRLHVRADVVPTLWDLILGQIDLIGDGGGFHTHGFFSFRWRLDGLLLPSYAGTAVTIVFRGVFSYGEPSLRGHIKQKIPSQHFCWDRILPAVPPGLTRLVQKERALFSRTDIRGSLLTEKSAPSPILRPGKTVSARPRKSIRPDAFRRARTNTRLSAGKLGRLTHSSSSVWQKDTTGKRALSRVRAKKVSAI